MIEQADVTNLVRRFSNNVGMSALEFERKDTISRTLVVFKIAEPTERHFAILEDTLANLGAKLSNLDATIEKRTSSNLLMTPEARALQRSISETANVNRYSFDGQFFANYVASLSGAEELISAQANHVVFGRRGAGKSSLLLFGYHTRQLEQKRNIWLDMQTYALRTDRELAVDILDACIRQVQTPSALECIGKIDTARRHNSDSASTDHYRKLIPLARGVLEEASQNSLFVFLDDFHLIDRALQASVLGFLYAATRGLRVSLKLSAIESLTLTWDPTARVGMQQPNDLQKIPLDLNLTVASQALEHVGRILDARARFYGLPSMRTLCTSDEVLPRLVWVSAGVPRDALTVFGQALGKAAANGARKVAVTNVNVSASENVSIKVNELRTDGGDNTLEALLQKIKEFCLVSHRSNAFLVEIDGTTFFKRVTELVDLRVLHVIAESITRGETARKYVALILDYGFYIGARKARNFELFNAETKPVRRADLRSLPVFHEPTS